MTIVKRVNTTSTPEQDFLFWIKNEAGEKIPVVIGRDEFTNGEARKTVLLPGGNYIVEEDTAYAWMYNLTSSNNMPASADNSTVTFTNAVKTENPGDKWLTGHAEINNIFDKTQPSSGGPVTLNNMDAILPTPTIPKEDGSDEDQPDNDQPDDLPEMTNAEGGAEHV